MRANVVSYLPPNQISAAGRRQRFILAAASHSHESFMLHPGCGARWDSMYWQETAGAWKSPRFAHCLPAHNSADYVTGMCKHPLLSYVHAMTCAEKCKSAECIFSAGDVRWLQAHKKGNPIRISSRPAAIARRGCCCLEKSIFDRTKI
jgi:hypothetical protein